MAENCGVTGVDGKLNDFLTGFKTLGRLVVRYEYKFDNYLAMVKLACSMILLKRYF